MIPSPSHPWSAAQSTDWLSRLRHKLTVPACLLRSRVRPLTRANQGAYRPKHQSPCACQRKLALEDRLLRNNSSLQSKPSTRHLGTRDTNEGFSLPQHAVTPSFPCRVGAILFPGIPLFARRVADDGGPEDLFGRCSCVPGNPSRGRADLHRSWSGIRLHQNQDFSSSRSGQWGAYPRRLKHHAGLKSRRMP
ncbi:uncharacterized protein PV07_08448 [Cladophialophora immunda]|uniref:Uncharacterized protein n=1 Tax=Cladophialophora immunda TaxID=569365 RepID=A0A0D2AK04_9EURO|nr:uncharacterized protein PV07_08448 [Cladophialophora immunda]KIW25257.1 hypothetical protein PV07_08448 [Cladophialophora immunda]